MNWFWKKRKIKRQEQGTVQAAADDKGLGNKGQLSKANSNQSDNSNKSGKTNVSVCNKNPNDDMEILRNRILEQLKSGSDLSYELFALYAEDAANCFPDAHFWEYILFKIDLETRKIWAKFEASGTCSYSSTKSLTAVEFHGIAKRYSPFFSHFKTEQDWDLLFDDTLQAEISRIVSKREQEERDKFAVPIAAFADAEPDMDINEVVIKFISPLDKSLTKATTTLRQENGSYRLTAFTPVIRRDCEYTRVLSVPEAAWMEDQINMLLNNTDNTPSKDTTGRGMSISIIKGNIECEYYAGKPLLKYDNLSEKLFNLAKYGSK